MVNIVRTFLEASPDAAPILEEVATAHTGDSWTLNYGSNRYEITRSQLEACIKETWSMAPTITCRRISKALGVGAPAPKTNSVKMYNDNLTQVRALLGQDFQVTIPVTRDNTNEVIQASVDLTHVTANLRTVAPQIWEQAEEGNL